VSQCQLTDVVIKVNWTREGR